MSSVPIEFTAGGDVWLGEVMMGLELDPGERVVSYLVLFDAPERALRLGQLRWRPTIGEVALQLGKLGGADGVPDDLYVRRSGRLSVYLTRSAVQPVVGVATRCQDYLRELMYGQGVGQYRVASPRVSSYGGAYCYLGVVPEDARLHVAAMLGRNPVREAVGPYALMEQYREWRGSYVPVTEDGADHPDLTSLRVGACPELVGSVALDSLGSTSDSGSDSGVSSDIPLDAVVPAAGSPVATPVSARRYYEEPGAGESLYWDDLANCAHGIDRNEVGVVTPERRLTKLSTQPDPGVDLLFAPQMDTVCATLPSHHDYVLGDGRDRLHGCPVLSHQDCHYVVVQHSLWAAEVDPGETVVLGEGRVFRPAAPAGGLLLSALPGVFRYLGSRKVVIVREMSPASWSRMLWRRLRFGDGSPVEVTFNQSDANLVFMPGSGYRHPDEADLLRLVELPRGWCQVLESVAKAVARQPCYVYLDPGGTVVYRRDCGNKISCGVLEVSDAFDVVLVPFFEGVGTGDVYVNISAVEHPRDTDHVYFQFANSNFRRFMPASVFDVEPGAMSDWVTLSLNRELVDGSKDGLFPVAKAPPGAFANGFQPILGALYASA